MRKAVFLLLFAAFLAGIFYWTTLAPKEDVSSRIYRTLKEQEGRADLSFKDVVFAEILGGEKFWELKAKSALINNSTGIATLQESRGTFFQKNREALRFVSPAALWDKKQKEIYLDQPLGYEAGLENKIASLAQAYRKERLSVFNLPGTYLKEGSYWFKANNLSWKVSDRKILCTNGILLNKGEVTGYAQRLESDVALEKVVLSGAPRVVVAVSGEAPVSVEAGSFEIATLKNLISARGGVKITWGEVRAWSDAASYYQQEKKIILEGRASAQQKDNRLSGDKILISLKDSKVSLLGKGRVVITEEELK